MSGFDAIQGSIVAEFCQDDTTKNGGVVAVSDEVLKQLEAALSEAGGVPIRVREKIRVVNLEVAIRVAGRGTFGLVRMSRSLLEDWPAERIPAENPALKRLSQELSSVMGEDVRLVDWTIPLEVTLAVIVREGDDDIFVGQVNVYRCQLQGLEAAILDEVEARRDFPELKEEIVSKRASDLVEKNFCGVVKSWKNRMIYPDRPLPPA